MPGYCPDCERLVTAECLHKVADKKWVCCNCYENYKDWKDDVSYAEDDTFIKV